MNTDPWTDGEMITLHMHGFGRIKLAYSFSKGEVWFPGGWTMSLSELETVFPDAVMPETWRRE